MIQRIVSVALVGLLCLFLSACSGKKLTKANFDKITNGMTQAEVQALIGEPDDSSGGDSITPGANAAGIDVSGGAPSSGRVLKWESGKKSIQVYMGKDNKVTGKKSDGI